MKTNLIKLGLVVGLSTSMFGFTYEIKDGWQQLGAVKDIDDLSVFNNQCIDYLWYYDNTDASNPEWKLHIADGNTYDYCGETLTSLKKGQGFWAKATGGCSITVGTDSTDCNSDMPAPPDLENPECMTCDTGSGDTETITHNGVTYGSVVSPYTGKTWLDRNLGASQVCTSYDDTECYGDYYQWGREVDGHQITNSLTTSVQATDIVNVGDKFIVGVIGSHEDWTTIDTDGSLRSVNWSKTDGTFICPIGYRVPTIEELKNELLNQGFDNALKAFENFLKVPTAGYRNYTDGIYHANATTLVIWSSDYKIVNDKLRGSVLQYSVPSGVENAIGLTFGVPVRCIKD